MMQPGPSENRMLFSLPPNPGSDFDQANVQNSDSYKALIEQIELSYKKTERVFAKQLRTFQWWHYSRVVMHWLLFMLGIGALIAALIIALNRGSLGIGVIFVGASIVAFVAFFIYQATQPVERTVMYITWLNIIYNSYLSSLVWIVNSEDALSALTQATEQASQQLQALLDHQSQPAKGHLPIP